VDYVPYTVQHVTNTLGMLGFTALGFFLLLKQLDPEPTISLDTDWFYRRGAGVFVRLLQRPLARLEAGFIGEIYEFVMRRPLFGVANLLRKADSDLIDAALVGVSRLTKDASQAMRAAATGHVQHYGLMMALGVLVLLVLALVVA
jgi:multicomponent Na+:H+ antiporter subunit D